MTDISNGQHWLDRNRPPRVQITYDVEIGDAIQKKELPLVVGILAGLGGDTAPALTLAKRPFVQIDRDNFDQVLADIAPTVGVTLADSDPARGVPKAAGVDGGDAGKKPVDGHEEKAAPAEDRRLAAYKPFRASLTFGKIEDFDPVQIVEQVAELKELNDIRKQLRYMLARLDGNVELNDELVKVYAVEEDEKKA